MAISCKICPAMLSDVSAGYFQRALVDESNDQNSTGMHNRSDIVALLGTWCVILHCKRTVTVP
jgi:hypothetical protein